MPVHTASAADSAAAFTGTAQLGVLVDYGNMDPLKKGDHL